MLVPGTAFFELATAAAKALSERSLLITELSILSPKALPQALQDGSVAILQCAVDMQSGHLAIFSAGQSISHVTAIAATVAKVERLEKVPSGLSAILIKHKETACTVASLAGLHEPAAVGAAAFGAHPAPADAVLHLGAAYKTSEKGTLVPVGVGGLQCSGYGKGECLRAGSCGWALAGESFCPDHAYHTPQVMLLTRVFCPAFGITMRRIS